MLVHFVWFTFIFRRAISSGDECYTTIILYQFIKAIKRFEIIYYEIHHFLNIYTSM